ncbi:class I SAM-dependent methyltransferase [Stieleria varia]|uniref:Ubiquinone/menaquinone biosynthesis methyltransferase n=1 Tax=Stieleria varia TaxID=2528005 RepID=A0A5C6ANX5_9BACT|nr:class I SAM-dependent methyltransferase [Stieleria varia]TWU01131.1 ubiquinone/menaquinone biosynthesis methyltransferase [Stieleria varia]
MTSSDPPPLWRRPAGVTGGIWRYTHQRSIADHYDDFVADTPLCKLDADIVSRYLPPLNPLPLTVEKAVDSGEKTAQKNHAADRPIVVDLGCGTGRIAWPLAENGYDVIGVDLSRPMLQTMLAKRQAMKTDAAGSVHALEANLVQLGGLRDDIADHAVCLFSTLGMIHGRQNRRETLRHAARIVRSGGTLIVHVHRRWAAFREPTGCRRLLRSWWNSIRNSGDEFGDAVYAYRGLSDMFMHRFSWRELSTDLRECGWRLGDTHWVALDGRTVVSRAWDASGMIMTASAT